MWVMRGMFWIEHGGEKQVQGYIFANTRVRGCSRKLFKERGGGCKKLRYKSCLTNEVKEWKDIEGVLSSTSSAKHPIKD